MLINHEIYRKIRFFSKITAIIAIILGVTWYAYWDALYNGFLLSWDTQEYVVNNQHIKGFIWENIYWMFTAFYSANWHPLTWLSHALDYAMFGLDPWGHHLTSIIIHSINVMLFFVIVCVLLNRYQTSIQCANLSKATKLETDNKTLMIAGIAALLFSIHPQRVESVAWIAERKDVLCLFFIFITFLCYIRYTEAFSKKTQICWYVLALFNFICALMSKPMAVTLPAILLLADVYPLHRTNLTQSEFVKSKQYHSTVSYKRLILEKIPFLVLSSISIVLTIAAQAKSGAVAPVTLLGLEIRLLNASNSLVVYLSKFIFPVNLSPLYPFTPIRSVQEHYLSLIPIVIFLLITFVCYYFWQKRHYYWLSSWLFFLIALSPVIGILQVGSQAAADRYTYFPTLPFYVLIGYGMVNLSGVWSVKLRKISQMSVIIIGIVISTILVQLTQQQVLVWKNDLVFWSYVALQTSGSPLYQVQNNVGNLYFEKGNYQKAAEYYEAATEAASLTGSNSGNHFKLALSYVKLNQFQKALEVNQYILDNHINTGQSKDVILANIGWLYFQLDRLPEAQQAFQQALSINPNNQQAQELLAHIAQR